MLNETVITQKAESLVKLLKFLKNYEVALGYNLLRWGDFATIGRGNDGIDLQNYNKAHRCALNSVTVVSKDDDRYGVRFRCMTPQECITPKNFENARMRMMPDVICGVMPMHYWQVTDPHPIFCNTYKQKNKIRGSS